MKRCHKRDQARIKCVGAVRVREIMRPPTNQSIRRHLSDCSLTSGCPVSPSLSLSSLVARTIYLLHSSPTQAPLAYRKRADAGHPRARDRVFDAYQQARMEIEMWTDQALSLENSRVMLLCRVPKDISIEEQIIFINMRLS